LTGVRTGELRLATPDQFDLERGLWIIPAAVVKQLKLRMRKKRLRATEIPPYIVPSRMITPEQFLSPQHPRRLIFEERHVVIGWKGNPI
jgi:integrase